MHTRWYVCMYKFANHTYIHTMTIYINQPPIRIVNMLAAYSYGVAMRCVHTYNNTHTLT